MMGRQIGDHGIRDTQKNSSDILANPGKPGHVSVTTPGSNPNPQNGAFLSRVCDEFPPRCNPGKGWDIDA
jgi:hypothetical protein